jgi:N6-L-threonylcarbamoyladenine synthase
MKPAIHTILAIESSCDETACSIVRDGREVLANVIASQIDLHAQFGGVVPEVAARSHIEVVLPVVVEALEEAKLTWDDIDAIAVTRGPGLIGSLLIGTLTAQVLAVEKNKPLIGVNHILAHAFASFLGHPNNLETAQPHFPMLAMVVSGGDSRLMLFQENLSFELLGQTRDDAAGEAFDKVAKLLGLPYPGGPNISRVATNGDDQAYKFPIAKLGDTLEYSFSGLKTAVLRQVQAIVGDKPGLANLKKTYQLPENVVADIAASFESTVVETLIEKLLKAYSLYSPASVVIGGGVSANARLRESILQHLPDAYIVPPVFCTDNAAMIGALAYQMAQSELHIQRDLIADSSLAVL